LQIEKKDLKSIITKKTHKNLQIRGVVIMFKKLEKNGFYYGFPVLLMTTKDKETGKSNITPLSSSFVLGKTIVVGIGFGNKGFKNIEAGSDVTFNVPDENLYESVKKIEKFTGDTEISEVKQNLGLQDLLN